MEIFLTQDKIAIVDSNDFELVSRYKWYAAKCGNIWYAVRDRRV